MSKAVLLHGTGGSDQDYYWFASIRDFLTARGYDVWWPQLPGTDRPELGESLAFVRAEAPQLDGDSIVIGHSSACPLILSWLEELTSPIRQAVLVSGYYSPLPTAGSKLMLAESYDWNRIRAASAEIVLINSDNDPWGCTDAHARPTAVTLGAPLVVNVGQGHMGSTSFDQPYREFPLLERLLAPQIPR